MKLPANTFSTNDGPLVACDSCSQVFKNKVALRRHLNLQHTGVVRFKCSDCGRILSSRQNLSEHKNIHTGQKPYACEYPGCQMRFRQGSQLSVHKRIHKAIMVYQSKTEDEDSLRLTDYLKDCKVLNQTPQQLTISGWEKLPLITEARRTTTLPSLHIAA